MLLALALIGTSVEAASSPNASTQSASSILVAAAAFPAEPTLFGPTAGFELPDVPRTSNGDSVEAVVTESELSALDVLPEARDGTAADDGGNVRLVELPDAVNEQLPSMPVLRTPDDGAAIRVRVTHYGERYNGQPMACGGIYTSGNAAIAAIGPDFYRAWPCGTQLAVCGPRGCIHVTRTDSCPGCSSYDVEMIDLSELGNELVCGAPAHTCEGTIEVLR